MIASNAFHVTMTRDHPEPFTTRCVCCRFLPPHRRAATELREDRVREPVREEVEIGQIQMLFHARVTSRAV